MTATMTRDAREDYAEKIRTALGEEGHVLVVYEPGDSTHYEFALVDLGDVARVAGADGDRIAGPYHERDRYLMADGAVGFRAMTVDLSPGHYTDPSYVLEKWRGTTLGSAVVIAELLNMVAGAPDRVLDGMRDAYPGVLP